MTKKAKMAAMVFKRTESAPHGNDGKRFGNICNKPNRPNPLIKMMPREIQDVPGFVMTRHAR